MSSKPLSAASQFTQTTPSAQRPTNPQQNTARTSAAQTGSPTTTPGATTTETPAQKVARLRAAHIAKRQSEISTWDIIVVRGRRVADFAHRWTVLGIVGCSVIMVGVTGWTITDMVRYNRAKKAEFYSEQSKLLKKRFLDALEAEGKGSATSDQLELLREERAVVAVVEAKKQSPGIWKDVKDRVKHALDLNLSREDRKYGERRAEVLERIQAYEQEVAARKEGAESVAQQIQAREQKKREEEERLLAIAQAEPLSQFDNQTTKGSKKGWFSWWS